MNNMLIEAYIVVVEDDQNDQLITLDLLRLAGSNRCFARRSVDAALSFAERLPHVDLFLVDINLPERSGYELLADVRLNEKLKTAYVVALTAGTHVSEVEKVRQLGFDGFLSKPIKAAEFAMQVEQLLNGQEVWDVR